MKINRCKKCGVILDDDMTSCPLCDGNGEGNLAGKPADILEKTRRESLRYTWELLGVVCISGISVSIALNLLLGGGITWSLYPATSIIWVWVAISIFIFLRKRPFVSILLLLTNTLGMLLLFNAFNTNINWFVPVGMPVTIVLFLLTGAVIYLTSLARHKGFNVLAMIFLALNILCIAIEVFINYNISGTIHIRWSAVVSAALVPISAVLMLLHYRLKKGRRLDSFFHL
jgi:hypothetical protein